MHAARAMKVAAEEGDWDRVIEIQRQRDQALRMFFEAPVEAAEASTVETGIREILAVDRRVLELSQARMQTLSGRLEQLHQGRKARQAYADHTG